MGSSRLPLWVDPAIRVLSAGLGAAVAGPLGGALGGWLAGVFSESSGHLIETYARKFGEKGGEKFLEVLTDSLGSKLKRPSPGLESVWRQALSTTLAAVHEHVREDGFESWFVNWKICLDSGAPLNLPFVELNQLAPQNLDHVFKVTMERLDSQGSAIQRKSLSISTPVRSMPAGLLWELTQRVPQYLEESFRTLIVEKENDQARKELDLALNDLLTGILSRIDENVKLIPRVALETAEIRRLVQDELLREVEGGRTAQETLIVEIQRLRDQVSESQADSRPSRITPPRLWIMPERNEFFSGRSDYLETLHRELSQSAAAAVTQRVSRALSGLGGIGKTQTAVEYAYRYREQYTAAFFILADSKESVELGFANIGRAVGEPVQAPDTALADRAAEWLEHPQHAGWLLIFDNVDDVAHVKHRIPSVGGHILITTRLNSVGRLAREVELPRMSAEEGAIFLLKRANRLDTKDKVNLATNEGRAALELSVLMGGLPLALEQAGAYIIEMSSSPAEYLSFFREEGVQLLGRAAADSDHDSVLVTFNLAFERLSEAARDAVCLCSLLAPEGIPEEVILGKQPIRTAREAIGEAARYSLIAIRRHKSVVDGAEQITVDIHRLVQDVVRSRMSSADRQLWVERALEAVNRTVFTANDVENRRLRARRLQSEHFAAYRVAEFLKWPPLDPVPYIITPQEWMRIREAIVQRATLLDSLLADVYGSQRLNEVVPAAVIRRGDSGYFPACTRLPAIHGRHLIIYAADILRAEDGTWTVINDATEVPSGISLALENRSVLSKVVPETLQRFEIRPLKPFFEEYLTAVRTSAPENRDDPHIVLLSPGRYNSAHFEHAYLAHQCQFTLVEGRDLFTNGEGVFQHTVSGPRRVDVIVRRVDTDFCDQLVFRADSVLGISGLVEAVRRGHVAVVNTLGSRFAERPMLRPYLQRLCRLFLDEELLMPTIPTFWCGEESAFRHIEEHLDQLIVLDADAGYRPVSDLSREDLLNAIRRKPERYIAQASIKPSRLSAEKGEEGNERYASFHVFAAAGAGGYSVMPGGLTTVADRRHLVGSVRGADSVKDTWVIGGLGTEPDFQIARSTALLSTPTILSLRLADSFFWVGRYAERLDFGVRRLLELFHRCRQSDRDENGVGRMLVCFLADIGMLVPDHERAWDTASIQELIRASYQDGQRRESLLSIAQLIAENAGSVELFLPRNAVASIQSARLILWEPLSTSAAAESVEEIEGRLQRVCTAIADFRTQAEASNWRDAGWDLLRIGHHVESFQLLREALADYGTKLIQDAEPRMLSDARQIASHVRSLPANTGLHTSLRDVAVILDRAVLDNDLNLANSSIDEIMALLDGTFIAGRRSEL